MPGDRRTGTPGDRRTGMPGDGTTDMPGDGSTGMQGDRPTGTPPMRSKRQASEGTTPMAGEIPTGMPGDGPTRMPGNGPTGMPGYGPTGMPGNGPTGMPGDGPSDRPGRTSDRPYTRDPSDKDDRQYCTPRPFLMVTFALEINPMGKEMRTDVVEALSDLIRSRGFRLMDKNVETLRLSVNGMPCEFYFKNALISVFPLI